MYLNYEGKAKLAYDIVHKETEKHYSGENKLDALSSQVDSLCGKISRAISENSGDKEVARMIASLQILDSVGDANYPNAWKKHKVRENIDVTNLRLSDWCYANNVDTISLEDVRYAANSNELMGLDYSNKYGINSQINNLDGERKHSVSSGGESLRKTFESSLFDGEEKNHDASSAGAGKYHMALLNGKYMKVAFATSLLAGAYLLNRFVRNPKIEPPKHREM